VFAASFALARPDRTLGLRIGLLSSRTGGLLRWLTPHPRGFSDAVLSVRRGWVYFVRIGFGGARGSSTWRERVTCGPAELVQAGATDYAVSPDGRAVAYLIRTDHRDVVSLVARNLVTGRRKTIVMAANLDNDNNYPPGIYDLALAPDDTHLAVQFAPNSAINSVLVFDAFTASTTSDGRTAPAQCAGAGYNSACGEFDPASSSAAHSPMSSSRYLEAALPAPAWSLAGRQAHCPDPPPRRRIPGLRHDPARTDDLGGGPGGAEGSPDDLALVRPRS
jgi:hypothetical protein